MTLLRNVAAPIKLRYYVVYQEVPRMPPGIDHVMINCNDYAAAIAFYSWLMPRIGYPQSMNFDQPAPTTGWFGAGGSIWVSE
jgi:hypothetical protein